MMLYVAWLRITNAKYNTERKWQKGNNTGRRKALREALTVIELQSVHMKLNRTY